MIVIIKSNAVDELTDEDFDVDWVLDWPHNDQCISIETSVTDDLDVRSKVAGHVTVTRNGEQIEIDDAEIVTVDQVGVDLDTT